MKTRLLTLWLVQHAAAVIWEFGSDVRGTSTIAQAKGRIASWDSETRVPLPVPTCMDVKYVHVEVKNKQATPVVTFNKHSSTVTITFKKPPSSHSKYEIMATGKRQAKCDHNSGGGGKGGGGKHPKKPGGKGSKHPGGDKPRDKPNLPYYPNQPGSQGKKPNRPGGGGQPSDDKSDEYPNPNRPGAKPLPYYPENPGGRGKKPNRPGGGRSSEDTDDEYPNPNRPGAKRLPDYPGGREKKPKQPSNKNPGKKHPPNYQDDPILDSVEPKDVSEESHETPAMNRPIQPPHPTAPGPAKPTRKRRRPKGPTDTGH